jgi:Tfp pilus assembly protein PilV
MTLPEVLIAAAISVLMAAALFSQAAGARMFAARSSMDALEAELAHARAIAGTSGNGATLVFLPASRGFTANLYRGRPNGSGAVTAAGPPLEGAADIREAALGAPPFTLFFDGAGHASAMAGAASTTSLLASDPGCPASEGRVVVSLSDGRLTTRLALACKPR